MRRLVTLFLATTLLGAVAAPVAAQSPTTTEELLSGMVTEEVEPRVLRVMNDGVRDLAALDPDSADGIAVGADGSVWLFGPSTFHRLGDERSYSWPFGTNTDLAITPDGRIWVGSRNWNDDEDRYEGVHVFDGREPDEERWTSQRSPDGHEISDIEIASDGTIWAAWADDDGEASIGQLEDDGWHILDGDLPDALDETFGDPRRSGQLLVGDDGVVWVIALGPDDPGAAFFWSPGDPGPDWPLYRYDAGEWRVQDAPGEGDLVAGPDGILWRGYGDPGWVARFDGTDWQTWSPGDGVPAGIGSPDAVAPDGTLWTASDSGLYSFDGVAWKRHMRGLVADAIAIAPDGSVWVQGRGRHSGLNTYVITPEAVAATE